MSWFAVFICSTSRSFILAISASICWHIKLSYRLSVGNRENKSQSNFDSMNGGKGQFFSLSFGKTTRLKGASKVTLLKPHVSY